MISRTDIIHIMKMKNVTQDEFNYDMLSCPPISSMFTQDDIYQLKYLATSARFSGNPVKKMNMIDRIMNARGFVKLSAGTNRICYRCREDNSFVVKVAYDSAGMHDSPAEYMNQIYLKPYCTKIFEVVGDGVLATAERVSHIKNREMFMASIEDIYSLLNDWIKGRGYLINDASSRSFMNFGIREGFGPVLLDFPYLFKINPKIKIKCRIPVNGHECGGTIGHDDSLGCMICYKCRKVYEFKDVAEKINNGSNEIQIVKGEDDNMLELTITGGTTSKNSANNTPVVNKVVETKEEKPVIKKSSTTGNNTRIIDNALFTQKKNDGIIRPDIASRLVLSSNKTIAKEEPVVVKEEEVKEVKEVVEEVAEEEVKAVAADALAVEDDNSGTDAAEVAVEEEPVVAATLARPEADDALVFSKPEPTLDEMAKDAIYNLEKVLGLFEASSLSDEAKKGIIAGLAELVAKTIDKLGNSLNAKQKSTIIESIFKINGMKIHAYVENNEVHTYIGDEEDGYYEEEEIVVSLADYVTSEDTEYTSEQIDEYDGTEEEAPAEEEAAEENDNNGYKAVEYFNARLVDISSIVTSEKPSNVIVITDDNNVPITTGDAVIAINVLDGKEVNGVSVVSTEYLNGIVSENDTLREAVEAYTITDEDASGTIGEQE